MADPCAALVVAAVWVAIGIVLAFAGICFLEAGRQFRLHGFSARKEKTPCR
ncbi:hypothetical protein [Oricola sp.]|uniref:hypothetical protein n=1 Tax=Oricola sp. TaxID=1979950 RepID=UPI0025DAED0C|nr:hypothetical protein [Oricola sp.]MCI5075673.1 hypothetical protein [Oricola sp.]